MLKFAIERKKFANKKKKDGLNQSVEQVSIFFKTDKGDKI